MLCKKILFNYSIDPGLQSCFADGSEGGKRAAIKLDLRGLIPSKDKFIGLSLPADTCAKYSEEEFGVKDDSPCYLARGRWDDGIYISIEYSTAYKEFREGYFIVVVGSSGEKDPPLMAALEKVKTKYSDAYIKISKVYMCCMH